MRGENSLNKARLGKDCNNTCEDSYYGQHWNNAGGRCGGIGKYLQVAEDTGT